MIICHCQSISDRDIEAAIDWMRLADPDTIITPGKIYRALGKRADCGGCMPLFLDTMRNSAKFGVDPAAPAAMPVPILNSRKGVRDEGRREGDRVSERGSQVGVDGGQPVLVALPAP